MKYKQNILSKIVDYVKNNKDFFTVDEIAKDLGLKPDPDLGEITKLKNIFDLYCYHGLLIKANSYYIVANVNLWKAED